jgi:hypothetical protein
VVGGGDDAETPEPDVSNPLYDPSTKRYFGKRENFAWIYELEQTDVPIGQKCGHCDEVIVGDDRGVVSPIGRQVDGELVFHHEPFHVECWMRLTLGSAAHIGGRCSCYAPGAREGDDPNLTPRQAAIVAYEMVLLNRNVS